MYSDTVQNRNRKFLISERDILSVDVKRILAHLEGVVSHIYVKLKLTIKLLVLKVREAKAQGCRYKIRLRVRQAIINVYTASEKSLSVRIVPIWAIRQDPAWIKLSRTDGLASLDNICKIIIIRGFLAYRVSIFYQLNQQSVVAPNSQK